MTDAPPHPSSRTAPRTRASILEAATSRFVRQGRDAVTMRQIAADTGLTMPTLYHHFGDKAKLYAACVDNVLELALHTLVAAFEAAASPADGVRAMAASLSEQLAGDSRLLAFLQLESALGSRPLARLVPPDLLSKVDKALGVPATHRHAGLPPALRLLAFAYGHAVVAQAHGQKSPQAGEALGLADALIAAARAQPGSSAGVDA